MTANAADTWAALADHSRRTIFELLAETPMAVSELAKVLPISRPAVSQHLRVLKDADLVLVRPVGTKRIYAANPAGLEAFRADVERFWTKTLLNFKRVAEESHTTDEEQHR